MEKKTIILYPSPGIGHLVSMVELAKLILNREPSYSIIIFISSAPYSTGSSAPYISHVSATTSGISFHHLPVLVLPPNTFSSFEEIAYKIPQLNNPNLKLALQTISKESSDLKAFIIDFFCTAAVEVSSNLEIPTYFFFTSGSSAMCQFLYLPTLHETITQKDLQDPNTYVHIPGIPPIHSLDLPKVLSNRSTVLYKELINTANQMAKCSGILINAFETLEPKAVKALKEGLCTPGMPTPPVYCIGPLIASGDKGNGNNAHGHEILTWLNSQPSKSVVFLCFGSLGTFKEDQLKEIAIGLENSGHRFLWVMKSPPIDDKTKRFLPPPEPDFNVLLPEGFLERTKERGVIVKSWAPQLAILNHDAIGGFVTHCGWNSVLEAICGGVPMLAWPLYAEQRVNRVCMVEEMKVALPLEESVDGFVMASEIEKRVKELVDYESSEAIRDQVKIMSEKAKTAVAVSGSSHDALTKLLDGWK
uniref:Glycosyltransferase n=1 Tax=Nemophila menziesii TaxID=79376 RepID=A0A292GFI2_NEMME|nr:flavone 4'-glucosyltransferase [Nemophila menziesii]